MTTSSTVSAIDTMVQELRLEHHRHTFVAELAHVVTALGTIPDSPASDFTVSDRNRLREIADEVAEVIERRIDSDEDSDSVKQHLASTIYEVRRRMEAIEAWFAHASWAPPQR
jgi:hypothetical protein